MDELIKLIKELVTKRFFGAIEIKFESGRIVLVRKTESIKLASQ
jgi:hypothetical protein